MHRTNLISVGLKHEQISHFEGLPGNVHISAVRTTMPSSLSVMEVSPKDAYGNQIGYAIVKLPSVKRIGIPNHIRADARYIFFVGLDCVPGTNRRDRACAESVSTIKLTTLFEKFGLLDVVRKAQPKVHVRQSRPQPKSR